MSTWTEQWVDAGRAAERRAADTPCPRCGGVQEVGYSNLGIPLVCCPTCQPTLYANRRKPVGDAWGFRERS